MLARGWLTAALIVAVCTTMSADAASARPKAVDLLDGRLTHKNFRSFDRFVARHVDKVVGLKVAVKKSGTDEKLDASISDGQFVTYVMDAKEPKTEVVANSGFAERSGDIVFDGFYLVKYGGFRQGIHSYALEPVDEAKVRLDPRRKVVTTRLK
jgi:hypothetical protein